MTRILLAGPSTVHFLEASWRCSSILHRRYPASNLTLKLYFTMLINSKALPHGGFSICRLAGSGAGYDCMHAKLVSFFVEDTLEHSNTTVQQIDLGNCLSIQWHDVAPRWKSLSTKVRLTVYDVLRICLSLVFRDECDLCFCSDNHWGTSLRDANRWSRPRVGQEKFPFRHGTRLW